MTDFAPWLRPAIFGPFLTMAALVSFSHLATDGAADGVFLAGQRFDSWLVAMLLASFVSAALSVNVILADVALLRAKSRKLPTGVGAWLSAMLTPVGLFLGWHLLSAPSESILEAVIRFGAPFPASALALRWLFGQRP
jgi:hypothetical protein